MPRTKKPRVGRPTLSDDGEIAYVQIKLAPSTRDEWQAAAAREGISLSEWLRAAGEAKLARGAGRSTR